MILVLSNVANESAHDLVGMFPSGAASLVTASDFNEAFRGGVSVGDFSSSEITIGGASTRAGEITGVVSTIAHFWPQEFYYIEPADREYVCAEMGAFFIYFLSELRCRKLNPPSSKTLSGLGLHPIEWLRAAQRCGVPLWPSRMKNGIRVPEEDEREVPVTRATLIGETIVEEGVPERIAGHLRALSRAFAMPYLSCTFAAPAGDDYLLKDLQSVPDIAALAAREAIVRFLGQAA